VSEVIDNRIVEMQFDNQQFESGVKTSMGTLSDLNKSLDKVGTNEGLLNIGKAAKGLSFDGIVSAVEGISSRFTTLGIIGVTALENITNRALNAGIAMGKALTIDPITTGFNEYELKMDNIQTTMVNTGESLESVNGILDHLNTYADKTIYKFSDMTTNLAKFTAAGIGLETAESAIMGISNAAAMAGIKADKAGNAMYNISQAYSTGFMRLIDWRSLEYSGIATTQLKQTVIDTAVEMGKLQRAADGTVRTLGEGTQVTAATMRNTLSEDWFDVELMNTVFGKYSDSTTELGKQAFAAAQDIKTASQLWDTLKEAAQSGWAANWQLIIGDFDEAKKFWTSVNNVIAGDDGFLTKMYDNQQKILKGWHDAGGRTTVIDALTNSWNALLAVIKPVKEAFREVFPATTSKDLIDISNALKTFSERLMITTETADKVKRTFKGIFSAVDIFRLALDAVVRTIADLIPGANTLVGEFLDGTASLGDLISGIRDYLKENDSFYQGLKKVVDYVGPAIDGVVAFVLSLVDSFEALTGIDLHIPTFEEFSAALGKIEEKAAPLTDIFEKVTGAIGRFFNVLFGNKTEDADISWLEQIGTVLAEVWETIKKVAGKISEAFSSVFSENGPFGDKEIGVGTVAGIAGVLLIFRKLWNAKDLVQAIGEIFGKFGGILGALGNMLDNAGDALSSFVNKIRIDALLKIAIAVGILTASIVVLASVDPDKLGNAIFALTAILAELIGALAMFKLVAGDKIFNRSVSTLSSSMMKIAAAVLLVSIAFKKLAELSMAEIGKGILAITVILGELLLFIKLADVSKFSGVKLGGLIATSLAVLVMSKAVENLGQMNIGELAKGVIALGVVLGILAGFIALTRNSSKVIATGTGLLILSAAVLIFSAAIRNLAKMSWPELAVGITAFAGALLIVAGALYLMRKLGGGKVIALGAGILLLSVAMIAIAGALAIMAAIGLEGVVVGLLGFGVSLGIVVAALALLQNIGAGNVLAISTAILILSAAMIAIAAALAIVAAIGLEGIITGLIGFAGALGILVIAMLVLNKTDKLGMLAAAAAILILSGAMVVLSIALLAMGSAGLETVCTGLIAFAGALAIFIVAGKLITPMIAVNLIALAAGIAAMGLAMLIMAPALEQLGNMSFDQVVNGLVALAGVIVIFAAAAVLLAPIEAPMIALAAALDLFSIAIWLVADGIEKASNGFANFIDSIGRLSKIKDDLDGVGEAIKSAVKEIKDAVKGTTKDYKPVGEEIANQLIAGINAKQTDMDTAAVNLANKALEAIKKLYDVWKTVGGESVSKYASGINSSSGLSRNAASNMAYGAVSGANYYNSWYNLGGNAARGYAQGIIALSYLASNASAQMARNAINAAANAQKSASPAKMFRKLGQYAPEGYALGVEDKSGLAEAASEQMVAGAITAAQLASDLISDILERGTTPSIRPVLDLGNIQDGAGRISGMLSGGTISTAYAMNNASGVSATMRTKTENIQNGSSGKTVVASGPVSNTFYITSHDPRGVAEEVSKIIQTDVERRQAVWGR
jgi:hypothetical protein